MRLRSAISALSLSLPERLPRRLLTMVAVAGLLAACGGHGNKQFLIDSFQVIGQVNDTNDQANATSDNKTGAPSAATLGGPVGNIATTLDGQTVFIADTGNYRVLGYSPLADRNGAAATIVLGQADFTSKVISTPARGTLLQPSSVSISADGSKLVVADTGNNRVLIWNSIPTTSGALPDVVVGQPGFVTADSSTVSATSLRGPTSAIIVGGKLLVADKGNNRVLIWNTVPTTNGVAADYQLGQVDLQTVCGTTPTTPCPGNASGGSVSTNTSSSGLYSPSSLWSDGSRLLVADTSNQRVLYWSVFPTPITTGSPRGTAADFVVGQTDFNRNQPGTAATLLRTPIGVTSDGSSFYVADSGNNRVLKFGSMPQASNPSATLVFGQYSTKFTAATPNDHDQNGTPDDNPDSDTLSNPTGVYIDNATFTVYITDTANNRVLLFPPSP